MGTEQTREAEERRVALAYSRPGAWAGLDESGLTAWSTSMDPIYDLGIDRASPGWGRAGVGGRPRRWENATAFLLAVRPIVHARRDGGLSLGAPQVGEQLYSPDLVDPGRQLRADVQDLFGLTWATFRDTHCR